MHNGPSRLQEEQFFSVAGMFRARGVIGVFDWVTFGSSFLLRNGIHFKSEVFYLWNDRPNIDRRSVFFGCPFDFFIRSEIFQLVKHGNAEMDEVDDYNHDFAVNWFHRAERR